jgi:hypothetical protein
MEVVNDMSLIIDEPTNNLEVIYDIYSKKLLEVWISYTIHVWNFFYPLEGIKPNESKWIFKRKTNMKGNV